MPKKKTPEDGVRLLRAAGQVLADVARRHTSRDGAGRLHGGDPELAARIERLVRTSNRLRDEDGEALLAALEGAPGAA